MTIPILLEDPQFLVVEKPAGLLSVPGRAPEKKDCVVSRMAELFHWVREVHRLDEPTSGCLLLALNPEAHRRLSRQFAQRTVKKSYQAILSAYPHSPDRRGIELNLDDAGGFIRHFQRHDWDNKPRQRIDAERGKEALTSWHNLPSLSGEIRVAVFPKTGRTHQIRLAFASVGAALLGDPLYAEPEVARNSARLLLHAQRLAFRHPESGEWIEVESVVPF